jgi:arylsulfatase A-like enzyme
MSKPRNIILLVADSLRYDAVHRGSDARLPYITSNGATFTEARSGGCWTLPATASLFTGLMPHEHGADAQSRDILPEVPTLAGLFHDAGWRTHQITANIATSEIFGLDRGFDELQRIWKLVPAQHRKIHELLVLIGKPRLRKKILSPEFVAGKLAEDLEASKVWLQSTAHEVFARARTTLAANEKAGAQSFLFLNLMETHFPYHVGPLFETTAEGIFGKLREIYSLYHLVNQTWLTTGQQPIREDMLRLLRERQRKAWERVAPQIDAFVEEMHRAGNLVVFCADHGDNFGEHGWVYHFSNVTDAGNRVPLFWLSPDGEGAGRRITVPVSTRDVFHGLLAEAGLGAGNAHPVRAPEQSYPVMQSTWYNNMGKTLPEFKHNQICLLEGGARWLHRQGAWYRAAPSADAGQSADVPAEPAFEALPSGFDPLQEGVIVPERRAYLRKVLADFSEYSRRVEA